MNPMMSVYGLCERAGPGLFEEPLNSISNAGFLIAGLAIHKYMKNHPDLDGQWIWDIRIIKWLTFSIFICSSMFHLYPSHLTELMDTIPIVGIIVLFFLSAMVRIARCNGFQTGVCFLAFLGSTHLLVSLFPNSLNDSIGYLTSMVMLIFIAVYLHLKARPSSQFFMLAAIIGVVSLFFRAVDNAVCDVIPTGTHFIWHICNSLLIYTVVRQLIRNVNREARVKRVARMESERVL